MVCNALHCVYFIKPVNILLSNNSLQSVPVCRQHFNLFAYIFLLCGNFKAWKFGMGFFGGLIFGAGFFDLLLPFDHPHHLKYRVPVGQ